jgi:hypothetical protein
MLAADILNTNIAESRTNLVLFTWNGMRMSAQGMISVKYNDHNINGNDGVDASRREKKISRNISRGIPDGCRVYMALSVLS